MGLSHSFWRFRISSIGLSLLVLAFASGCQVGAQTASQQILYQQSLIDFSGLKPLQSFGPLKISGAVPDHWEPLPLKDTALYTHQQWRSPTITTGIGVAYIHTPLPLPASAILWFAKREYTKREDDGQALGQWTDAQGREWFEAENNKYHVRGYVVTHGFDAWIVYCGYKRAHPPSPRDISLAARSAETMLPGITAK